MPQCIITDLGTTFTSNAFSDYCDSYRIEVCYSSIAHPKVNEQIEHANVMLLDDIKHMMFRLLKNAEGHWMKELYPVIWGLRTQRSKVTGKSSFFMVYGSGAILPVDMMFDAPPLGSSTLKIMTSDA